MSKKLFLTLSAATLLAAPIGTARADLILSSQVPISGSGIGAQNTILTIQNTGTESGCVGRAGGTDFIGTFANVMVGSVTTGTTCTAGTNTDVKTGSSQTQTRLLSETGVTSAANFGIIFNAVEPSGDAITINRLSATFYRADGSVAFVANTGVNALGQPISFAFPNTLTGQGNSGFLFVLDAAQQTAATAAGAFAGGGRVGVGASVSGAAGGNETFFVGNTGTVNVSTVPEPSTYALMAAGLAGVFGFARRRRNRTA